MDKEKKIEILNINDILPNRFQPRIKFDGDSLNELSESIKEYGVIQPITVRPLGDKYEIIAGERRYKASIMAGKTTIPAVIIDLNDKESAEIALIENIQRKDLTPIEEAISYKKILDMKYLNQEQLADKVGKQQSTVANKIRLLNLIDEVQEALLDGEISERHARSLLRVEDAEKQKALLNRIIEERLTVRKTDEEIDKMINEPEMEVLDFEFTNNNPTPTNNVNKVNDDEKMDKFYNIPSSPIVEDTEEEQIVAPTPIDPGFMNVDKIEQEATNIYQDKPVANIDDLLKSTTTNKEETPVKKEEEPESKFKTGRFFAMVDDEEDDDDQTGGEVHFEPVDPRPSLKDQMNVSPIENKEPQPILEEQMQQTPVENLQAQPIVETVVPQPTLEEEMKPTSIENIQTEKLVEPTDSRPSLEEQMNTNIDITPKDIERSESTRVPLESEVITPTSENSFDDDTDEIPPVNYETVDNTTAISSPSTSNLSGVINIIRDCSDDIEKLGYIIDTEEFDFEDLYQVIFKIQKDKK